MSAATEPVTNTDNAVITVTAFSPTAEPLALVSSNLVYEPSGGEYFVQWFAEVRNDGPIALCHVQAEVDFEIGGAIVQHTYGFASADPYLSALDIPCIPPDGIGVVYDNGFVPTPPTLSSIDKLNVTLEGADYGDQVPHPLAPTVGSAVVVETYGPGSGYFSLTGSVLATGTIYNVGMKVYPISSQGLVYDQLLDFHLETLQVATSWPYETTSAQAAVAFTEYHQYVDFLAGAEPLALAFSVTGTPEPPDALHQREAERRALSASQDERRAQFHPLQK